MMRIPLLKLGSWFAGMLCLASVTALSAGPASARPTNKGDRSFVGTYIRVTTVNGKQQSDTLEIKEDKTILWSTAITNDLQVVMTGIWNYRGETLVVVLGTRDGVQLPAGVRVVFDRTGKKLKGRMFDRARFGNGDLVFVRSENTR